jgi:hypothetical protein
MIFEVKGIGHIDLLSVVVVQPLMNEHKTKVDYHYVLLLGGHTITVYDCICKRDFFIGSWIRAKSLQLSTVN